MDTMSADARNADQIAFWNGPGGQRWVARQEAQDAMMAPVAAAAIARAAVRPGERVIDIGCGCGATTIALGEVVGPAGRVLGLDISEPMLARAAARVPPGLAVEFVRADATTHALPRGDFDLLFSRFGVMFFAEPERAFANLRAALRPGGRLVFACFRAPQENPWMMAPVQAASAHLPAQPKPGPDDPGPFAFANEARVRRILDAAGFQDVTFEKLDLEFDLGGGRGLEAAVIAALETGPTSRALQGQPAEIREAAAAAVRQTLASYQRGETVPLPAAIWLVAATSP